MKTRFLLLLILIVSTSSFAGEIIPLPYLVRHAIENADDTGYLRITFKHLLQNDPTLTIDSISNVLKQINPEEVVLQQYRTLGTMVQMVEPLEILFCGTMIPNKMDPKMRATSKAPFHMVIDEMILPDNQKSAAVSKWLHYILSLKCNRPDDTTESDVSVLVNGPLFTELVVRNEQPIITVKGTVVEYKGKRVAIECDDFFGYELYDHSDHVIVLKMLAQGGEVTAGYYGIEWVPESGEFEMYHMPKHAFPKLF